MTSMTQIISQEVSGIEEVRFATGKSSLASKVRE